MSLRPHLVLVGGFLGAGKTSLIVAAAQFLRQRGIRSAIVLNDQSDGLVDTAFATASGFDSGEVAGGCFCCRFTDFVDATERLRQFHPDVIFAEPVGSCTDIAATTIRPLLSLYPDLFRIAPFTVVADPARAEALSKPGASRELSFLLRKQLEEADLVCWSKADLFPGSSSSRQVSARTGQGIAAWLDEVLSGELRSGQKELAIDYEEYAAAEASLVWLNASAEVEAQSPVSPSMLLGPLFDSVVARLTVTGAEIVHFKAIDQCGTGYLKAAICTNREQPSVEGELTASPCSRHHLRLNLRAGGDPDSIRNTIEQAFRQIAGEIVEQAITCFRPLPPRPEHRFLAS